VRPPRNRRRHRHYHHRDPSCYLERGECCLKVATWLLGGVPGRLQPIYYTGQLLLFDWFCSVQDLFVYLSKEKNDTATKNHTFCTINSLYFVTSPK
jgi:hypothetical protein